MARVMNGMIMLATITMAIMIIIDRPPSGIPTELIIIGVAFNDQPQGGRPAGA